MKKEQKGEILQTLKDRFAKSTAVVLADFQGIKVDRLQSLGRDLKLQGEGLFQVAKNTLAYLAVEGTPGEALREYLHGQTAVAFAFGDPSAMAKVIAKYIKKGEQEGEAQLVLKGALLEGAVVDAAFFLQLATLPSRPELLAAAVRTIAAPLQSFVNVLQAPVRDLIFALRALESKKGSS